MKDLNFEQALEQVMGGKLVAREGWGTCNRSFVFERPSDTLAADFIPKVKSLPDSIKKLLIDECRDIEFTAYLCLWEDTLKIEARVLNGWSPSPADLTTADWYVKED